MLYEVITINNNVADAVENIQVEDPDSGADNEDPDENFDELAHPFADEEEIEHEYVDDDEEIEFLGALEAHYDEDGVFYMDAVITSYSIHYTKLYEVP